MAKKPRLFRYGYIYELRQNQADTREERRYRFVIPAHYADGCWLADCYRVDAGHNVCPGYEYPTPVNIDDTQRGVPLRSY